MKQKIKISAVFLAVFAATFLFLSFCVPGWRIKLAAPPLEYFVEQLKSMSLIKCSVSLITGATAGLIASKYVK